MATFINGGYILGAETYLMSPEEVQACKQNFRDCTLENVVIVYVDECTCDLYHVTAFNEDASEVYYIKETPD